MFIFLRVRSKKIYKCLIKSSPIPITKKHDLNSLRFRAKLSKEMGHYILKIIHSIFFMEEQNHIRLNVGEDQEVIYVASRMSPFNPCLKPCSLYKSGNNFKKV
jgi:hypothetical protein